MIVDLEDIEEHFPLMFLSFFWKEHLSEHVLTVASILLLYVHVCVAPP